MADLIQERFGLTVELKPGGTGEFSVVVDGKIVAEKNWDGFPAENDVLDAVGAVTQG